MTTPPATGYIFIPNWKRHQHYKNRRPTWIKLYIDLVDDIDTDGYLSLTAVQRAALHGIWMLVAGVGNARLLYDCCELRARLRLPRLQQSDLDLLVEAGWIDVVASKKPRFASAEGEGESSKDDKEGRASAASAARPSKRQRRLEQCKALYESMLAEGDSPAVARDSLAEMYRDEEFINEALEVAA